MNFRQCVKYLLTEGYLPKGTEEWVDRIRNVGNEAAHEIVVMHADEAKDIIRFSEMILKNLYEFPALLETEED